MLPREAIVAANATAEIEATDPADALDVATNPASMLPTEATEAIEKT